MSELHSEACKAFDNRIAEIRALVETKAPPKHPPTPVDPDTHVVATLTDKDLVGDLVVGTVDPLGRSLERWILVGESLVGLDGENFKRFRQFCADLQDHKLFRNRASLEFMEKSTFAWLTEEQESNAEFSRYIQDQVDDAQSKFEYWIPIARLRTTRPITVGKVVFKRITKAMVDGFEKSQAPFESDDVKQAVESFILRLRRTCQGYTAGTIEIPAELERGRELAYQEVDTALSMLRFFEPGSVDPNQTSYLMPLGQEAKGTRTSFVVEDGVPNLWTEGQTMKASMNSDYPAEFIAEMGSLGLAAISRILAKTKHSKFESRLLEALTIYSRVSISSRLSDKLVYALVALESLFLRNQSEPIQQNLGERIAFLIGQSRDERIAIVALVKEIYKIRSQVIHHGRDVPSVQPKIEEFFSIAWTAIHGAISNANLYTDIDALLSELDRRKMS